MKARLLPLMFGFVLACALAASGQQAGGEPTHRIPLRDKDWALDVALPGYHAREIGPSANEDYAYLTAFRTGVKRSPAFTIELSRARGGWAEPRSCETLSSERCKRPIRCGWKV